MAFGLGLRIFTDVGYKINMAKVVDALEGLLWITALTPLWVLYFRTKMSTVATVHLLVTHVPVVESRDGPYVFFA